MLRTLAIACTCMTGWVSLAAGQPPARPADRPIVFYIYVPADAQIEIEGVKTTKTGEVRDFKTPDVPIGKRYGYTVKVTYQGKTTTHQLSLTHTGQNVLDLRKELTTGKVAAPAPAAATPAGATITLLPPSSVSMRAGDSAPLTIKIKRQSLNDAVELTFQNLPAGVRINDATIAAGKEETAALAMSEITAKTGSSAIDVVARCGRVQKQATFRLTITNPPPPPTNDAPKKPAPAPSGPVKKDTTKPPADLPQDDAPPMPPKPGESKKDDKPKPPVSDLPADAPKASESKKPAAPKPPPELPADADKIGAKKPEPGEKK
jgi:uncharacterized protein (TIGR03000 family)